MTLLPEDALALDKSVSEWKIINDQITQFVGLIKRGCAIFQSENIPEISGFVSEHLEYEILNIMQNFDRTSNSILALQTPINSPNNEFNGNDTRDKVISRSKYFQDAIQLSRDFKSGACLFESNIILLLGKYLQILYNSGTPLSTQEIEGTIQGGVQQQRINRGYEDVIDSGILINASDIYIGIINQLRVAIYNCENSIQNMTRMNELLVIRSNTGPVYVTAAADTKRKKYHSSSCSCCSCTDCMDCCDSFCHCACTCCIGLGICCRVIIGIAPIAIIIIIIVVIVLTV